MFPRKFSFPLVVIFCACVIFVVGACGNTRAVAERTESVAGAPVVQVSPTPGQSISISAVGDIMLGSSAQGRGLPANDGADLIAPLASILSSTDIAFGNLEGAMIDGGTQTKCGPNSKFCYTFGMPTRYAKHLKDVGFDVMSIANNHSSDFGAPGRISTRKTLQEYGIIHSGYDPADIPYMDVKGRKVAVVSFATNPVSLNLIDVENSRRVVAEVARKADIVIVSFHGGAEGSAAQRVPHGSETYLGNPRGNLRAFTRAVVDAGADLVLGHGPHVLRGMEVYKGRLIAYSLGNFAFYAFPFRGPTALSLVLDVNLAPDGSFAGGQIHPLKQEGQSGPRLDKTRAVIAAVRQLSAADFGASAARISEDGVIAPPDAPR